MMDIQATSLDGYRLMSDGILALARAERAGIRCDVDYIHAQQKRLTKKIERGERKFKDTKLFRHWDHSQPGKINIHSDAQLANFLYKVKKIKPPKHTPSGQGATDEETLKDLGIPEMADLIQIRKLMKVRDTYLGSFLREQVNGYIHPSYNLHLPRTFRSSVDRPNFQNIPKRDKESMTLTRKALFPRPGHQLLELDYSGLEVKIAACYHEDPNMLKYIHDPSTDMHADMASQIFMIDPYDKSISELDYLRAAAKNGFVFPEFYGDYFGNCAQSLACRWGELPHDKWKRDQGVRIPGGYLSNHMIENGISSLGGFTNHIKDIEKDFWTNRFPDYAAWKERWWKTYQKNGFIKMKTGFECSGVMGRNDCINYPVQGAAFHCLLWSFIELDKISRKEGWRSRLIGQIHDAIVFDIYPPELETILRIAQRVTCEDLPKAWKWINVPLEVDAEICDVDASWADKKKLELA
jgi:DNA polymerase-1